MERCTVAPYEGERDYLFISYSHRDAAIAIPIIEQLASEGYRLWYDEGIDPGSEWPETIAEHLGGAAACIGLISNNYLASDNCRREMNFALKKQLPYLSILLEEVQMSAGVEMQLSANQAIFKYKLPSKELFLRKIHGTKSLQPARELPQPKTPVQEMPPEAPAAPIHPLQPKMPVQEISPEAPAAPIKLSNPARATTARRGKKIILPIVLGAVAVLVIAVLVSAIAGVIGKSSSAPTQESEMVTEATDAPGQYDLAAPDAPVNEETFLTIGSYAGRLLWGLKTSVTYPAKDDFLSHAVFVDIEMDGNMMNVSALPYAIEVRPDEAPEILRLYFLDKVGTEHIVQGAFSVSNGMLTVTPADKAYDDARVLDETLTYKIATYYGQV
ncbi:MAG: TIR domain-containing protein [Clostridia bacterium]|nr:TIR domain-containing protein [Clostridia bacterium]